MVKRFCLLGLACVLFVGAGCVSTHTPPADRRVTVAPELGTDVWVTDVRMAKGSADHYTLQANVVNNTRSVAQLKYRVVWLDENGVEFSSVNAQWRDISISAKDIMGLKSVAPTPTTADFRIHIKAGY